MKVGLSLYYKAIKLVQTMNNESDLDKGWLVRGLQGSSNHLYACMQQPAQAAGQEDTSVGRAAHTRISDASISPLALAFPNTCWQREHYLLKYQNYTQTHHKPKI